MVYVLLWYFKLFGSEAKTDRMWREGKEEDFRKKQPSETGSAHTYTQGHLPTVIRSFLLAFGAPATSPVS